MVTARPGYIGIDIGGTNLRLALVDDQGHIICEQRRKTEIYAGKEVFFHHLNESFRVIRGEGGTAGVWPKAVGVGVPGLIANDGLVHVSVNLPALDGVNLRDALVDLTGLPVVVANDVNACAYGEMQFGAGRSFASFLMVTLGTGVGGGLILNNRLWTGVDGVAGEFGHMTVEPGGRSCACGNRGCLEQYASATAIVAVARELIATRQQSLVGVSSGEITPETLAEIARGGNDAARRIFTEAARYLGIAAASVANLLNLEAIILGGGVAGSFDLLQRPLEEEIISRAFPIPGQRLKVLRSQLGNDGGMLGAAALAMALDASRPPSLPSR